MLGGLFAEHLITGYGARRLLLTSRRGASTPEAVELAQRLQGLGADVTISACDCANPSELAALIGSIPAEHPLTAVIHAAGVLDDAVTSQLTAQQLDNVLAAKADSAWYLHQLTANTELAAFVLFSSAAGVLGARDRPTTRPPTPSSTHWPVNGRRPSVWPGGIGSRPPG
ncbi:short chain dehydrogenase family protein [Mycobacterium kansasii]|uniref:Short chain dehydrogenase family protein n=1 Tax=Mycobacterium kansasii TaxID=1768 RepID=A0A1V3WKP5_MYCKA|nr:short chain dehydrogenase family protein [Mycobacterium kansasii]